MRRQYVQIYVGGGRQGHDVKKSYISINLLITNTINYMAKGDGHRKEKKKPKKAK